MIFLPPTPPPLVAQVFTYQWPEEPLMFATDRGASDYFNNVVAAGDWQLLTEWLNNRQIPIRITRSNGRQVAEYLTTSASPSRPPQAACGIIMGRGGLRGAIMICVGLDEQGNPLDPRIWDEEYLQSVAYEVYNFDSPY